MQAINGYLENGQFIPNEQITLPRRVQAILVFNDNGEVDSKKETGQAWLKKFYATIEQAKDEEMPDFPRASFERKLLELPDEE